MSRFESIHCWLRCSCSCCESLGNSSLTPWMLLQFLCEIRSEIVSILLSSKTKHIHLRRRRRRHHHLSAAAASTSLLQQRRAHRMPSTLFLLFAVLWTVLCFFVLSSLSTHRSSVLKLNVAALFSFIIYFIFVKFEQTHPNTNVTDEDASSLSSSSFSSWIPTEALLLTLLPLLTMPFVVSQHHQEWVQQTILVTPTNLSRLLRRKRRSINNTSTRTRNENDINNDTGTSATHDYYLDSDTQVDEVLQTLLLDPDSLTTTRGQSTDKPQIQRLSSSSANKGTDNNHHGDR